MKDLEVLKEGRFGISEGKERYMLKYWWSQKNRYQRDI